MWAIRDFDHGKIWRFDSLDELIAFVDKLKEQLNETS